MHSLYTVFINIDPYFTFQHHNPSPNQLHIQQQQRHQQQQHQNQHHHHQQQQQNFPRQQSFEATWQDLVNILDLPSNNSVDQTQPAQVNNMLLNNSVAQIDNTSSVLLQNASMPTPAPINENVTFNNAGGWRVSLYFFIFLYF